MMDRHRYLYNPYNTHFIVKDRHGSIGTIRAIVRDMSTTDTKAHFCAGRTRDHAADAPSVRTTLSCCGEQHQV